MWNARRDVFRKRKMAYATPATRQFRVDIGQNHPKTRCVFQFIQVGLDDAQDSVFIVVSLLLGTLRNDDDDEAVNSNEKCEFTFMRSFLIIPTRSACELCSTCPGIKTGMNGVDINRDN